MDSTSSKSDVRNKLATLLENGKRLNHAAELQDSVSRSRIRSYQEISGFLVDQWLAARKENEEPKKLLGKCENFKKKKSQQLTTSSKVVEEVGRNDVLNIFPLEVWNMIFGCLDNGADVASCYRTSKVFEKELQPKRIEFLFPEVLQILIKNGYLKPSQIFEQCLQYRLVCRRWKGGVDHLFNTHQCHSHLTNDCIPPSYLNGRYQAFDDFARCFPKQHFYFKKTEQFQRCQTYIQNHHLSPSSFFLGRYIRFRFSDNRSYAFDEPEPDDQMWEVASAFLKEVGNVFWHCILKLSLEIEEPSKFYQVLLEFFAQMPNLKALEVDCENYRVVNYHNQFGEVNDYHNLENLMRECPLAQLKNLQVFRVNKWFPQPVIRDVLRGCSNTLKTFQFTYPDNNFEKVYYLNEEDGVSISYFDGISFPNLEILSITISLKYRVHLEHFSKLLESCPSLHDLSVCVLICHKFKNVAELFSLIEQKKNIKTLALTFRLTDDFKYQDKFDKVLSIRSEKLLKMPLLENLKIVTKGPIVLEDIDFILPLQTLKKLTVFRGKLYSNRGVEMVEEDPLAFNSHSLINYFGYESSMYDSNIWRVHLNLKGIQLKIQEGLNPVRSFYSYNRVGYEKHCGKQTNLNSIE